MNFSCAEIHADFDVRDHFFEKHCDFNKKKEIGPFFLINNGDQTLPPLTSHLITLRLRAKYIASRKRNFLQNGG